MRFSLHLLASREGLRGMGFNLQQSHFAHTLETGLSTICTVEKLYDIIN